LLDVTAEARDRTDNHSRFPTLVGGPLLDGGNVDPNGGTVPYAGVYDEAYTFFASSCP